MINIIVDWKEGGNFFLYKELQKTGMPVKVFDIPNYNLNDRVKKYRLIFLYFKYIQLSFKTIMNSNVNDLIICWNFTTSIAVGWICKLLGKKRTILGLNIIAHKKNKLAEKFRKLIFSPIMKMDKYYLTVNSEQYIEDYASRFGISNKKFFILHDPIQSEIIQKYVFGKSYIFVGGEAQRDWDTLFKAAQFLPEIKFICIARKKYFNPDIFIPSNVELYFDLNENEFYNYMKNSSIVVIPLKSELPCGLIVLLKAAMMNKPIIATKTPSTSNYIDNGKSGLLVEMGNYEELIKAIKKLYNDENMQRIFTKNLINHIKNNYSQTIYASRLIDIINIVNSKDNTDEGSSYN